MGLYLDPNPAGFVEAVQSEIYVDKSELIKYTNKVFATAQKNICISRPRRFGKSMAANMLCAYYGKNSGLRSIFEELKIYQDESFEKHFNQYHVIALNVQMFLSETHNVQRMIEKIQKSVAEELQQLYPDIVADSLTELLARIFDKTNERFVFIIDEWDCIFREKRENEEGQIAYLEFLRNLLKDRSYVGLAYMTGILPIKKYGSHSALNMFTEFSMTNPRGLATYVGFTDEEVLALCEKYGMDYEEASRWYNGYTFRKEPHIYSPKSVVDAMLNEEFDSYWTQTETYDALKMYIEMNYDGLRDSVVEMLSGGSVKINTATFQNDMTSFQTKDDVLTLLIHLGYLAYDSNKEEVFIPNYEVSKEYRNALQGAGWNRITEAIQYSEQLLQDTWNQKEEAVAKAIEEIHLETSVLSYNNENSLACTIALAYYSAKIYYTEIRELPTGKGFADIIFIPRKNHLDKPAMIVELKWDRSVEGAIAQIKEKKYMKALEEYKGNVLLVAINYDKKNKKHECKIEDELCL